MVVAVDDTEQTAVAVADYCFADKAEAVVVGGQAVTVDDDCSADEAGRTAVAGQVVIAGQAVVVGQAVVAGYCSADEAEAVVAVQLVVGRGRGCWLLLCRRG